MHHPHRNPPSRTDTLALVRRAPGLHVAEIARRLRLSWSGAAGHLRALEKEGLVHSALESRRRVYFASEARPEDIHRFRALAAPSATRVAKAIVAEPGLTVREVAIRARLSPRVTYHHARRLREVGLVVARGEPMRLFPSPALPRHVRYR